MRLDQIITSRAWDARGNQSPSIITSIGEVSGENASRYASLSYVCELNEPLLISLLSPSDRDPGVMLCKRWAEADPIERWAPKFYDSDQCIYLLLEDVEDNWDLYEKRQNLKGRIEPFLKRGAVINGL